MIFPALAGLLLIWQGAAGSVAPLEQGASPPSEPPAQTAKELSLGFRISPLIEYRSGFPYAVTDDVIF